LRRSSVSFITKVAKGSDEGAAGSGPTFPLWSLRFLPLILRIRSYFLCIPCALLVDVPPA
jgi:hypothetical protein